MKFVAKELQETADISAAFGVAKGTKRTLAILLGCGLLGYLLLVGFAELVARRVPDAWEARWFAETRRACAKPSPGLERAGRALGRLQSAAALRDLPYCVFLLDTEAPNAVALPGGAIGVTQGLLQVVKTERGLAMVLAHELGHHEHRDVMRRMGRRFLLGAALSAVFGSTGGAEDLAQVTSGALESRYARGQEDDADAFGLRLVHQAYGTTEHALEFFEGLADQEPAHALSWLASHPLSQERLKSLRELQRQLATREQEPPR